MRHFRSSLLVLLAAGPALAQENVSKAVGTGVGLLVGIVIMIFVGAVLG